LFRLEKPQKAGKAENQKSKTAKKQRSKALGKAEKQRSRETEIQEKTLTGTKQFPKKISPP
jgi:hypothetical protein